MLADLTPAQMETLVLVADGMTNKEISERRCVSIHTTKTLVRQIMTRLNADTRGQAIAFAYTGQVPRKGGA